MIGKRHRFLTAAVDSPKPDRFLDTVNYSKTLRKGTARGDTKAQHEDTTERREKNRKQA
jgi:hypothetical protein